MRPATRIMIVKALTWSAQIWLSMAFFGAGYAKLTVPGEHLILMLGWPAVVPLDIVRIIGAAEGLLGFALVANLIFVPSARQPAIAAAVVASLYTVVMGAYHLIAHEFWLAVVNLVLLVLTRVVLSGYRSGWANASTITNGPPSTSGRRQAPRGPHSLRRGRRPAQRLKTYHDYDEPR